MMAAGPVSVHGVFRSPERVPCRAARRRGTVLVEMAEAERNDPMLATRP